MKYFLLLILTLPSLAFADKYFIKKVVGKSSSQDTKDVIQDLFEAEITDLGQDIERDPRKADYMIGLRVIRFGDSHIISVQKRKGGKTLHADKLKASSPDEFDKVVSRLAEAVVKEAKGSPKIGKITRQEQDQVIERTKTKWYKSYGFGPAVLVNHGTAPEKMGYHLSLSQIGEITPHFALRFTLESTFVFNDLFDGDDNTKGTVDSFSAANLGANYFFTTGNISPFITGHLGLGRAMGSSIEDDGGFTWGGGAGVAFFRTSDTQLALTVSYTGLINSDLAKNPGQASFFISLLR